MVNQKYNRLQIFVPEKFDLDAPVEIEKGALLLESKSGTIILQLRLNILDEARGISSVTLKIQGFTDSGESVKGFSPYFYTFQDVYLNREKTFGDRTPIILDSKIRKVEVAIDNIVFRDGFVWNNNYNLISVPEQANLTMLE